MSGRTVSVVLLLVVGLAAAAYAGILYFTESTAIPSLTSDRAMSAIVAGVLSAVTLLLALVLSFLGKKPAPAEPAPAAASQPTGEVVVIKRTEMNWGGRPGAEGGGDLEARLDDVNARIGRLKVQLGLGEISAETYKALVAQLEQEKSQLEMARYQASQP